MYGTRGCAAMRVAEQKNRRLHCRSLGGATWSNYEWFNLIFCRLWNITVSYNKTNGIKKHVIYR